MASNGIGFGGGAVRVTTVRATAAGGGATAALFVFTPSTLVRCGATGAVLVNEAAFNSPGETRTEFLATGNELVSVRCGTAVTAPATFWFA